MTSKRFQISNAILLLAVAGTLGACGGGGGGGGDVVVTPPPPVATTFQASLTAVEVIDRNDGSTIPVTGSVDGAMATLP
ncbi:MAG: hypothetical protein AAF229_14340 [Pseudomonadota bacterium]